MKPGYVSKRTTSFPILEFLVLLFIFQCSLVLAETPDGHIPESPASPAPNAEETESESVPPAATTPAPSPDSQTISESEPTSEEPLPPVPTKAEAENTGRFRRHLDFFGMNLGGGVQFFFAKDSSDSSDSSSKPVPNISIYAQLLNFRLNHLYFSFPEIYVVPLYGILGGGLRMGYRMPLNASWRSEIRVGATLGGGVAAFWVPVIITEPHVEYVYNTKHTSVGVGLKVPLMFLLEPDLEEEGYYHTASVGVAFYFHFSVGRIELKRREREDLRLNDPMDKNQESGMNP